MEYVDQGPLPDGFDPFKKPEPAPAPQPEQPIPALKLDADTVAKIKAAPDLKTKADIAQAAGVDPALIYKVTRGAVGSLESPPPPVDTPAPGSNMLASIDPAPGSYVGPYEDAGALPDGFDPFKPPSEQTQAAPKNESELGRITRGAVTDSLSGQIYKAVTGKDLVTPPKDMGFWENLASQVVSLGADPAALGTMGLGGVIGKAALKKVLTATGKKELAHKLAANAAGHEVTFTPGEKFVINAAQGAGGFGAFSGAESAAQQQINTGQVSAGQTLADTAKGAALGAATAGAGMIPGKGVLAGAARAGAEAETLSQGQSLMDTGQFASLDDQEQMLGLVLGVKALHHAVGSVLHPAAPQPAQEDTQAPLALPPPRMIATPGGQVGSETQWANQRDLGITPDVQQNAIDARAAQEAPQPQSTFSPPAPQGPALPPPRPSGQIVVTPEGQARPAMQSEVPGADQLHNQQLARQQDRTTVRDQRLADLAQQTKDIKLPEGFYDPRLKRLEFRRRLAQDAATLPEDIQTAVRKALEGRKLGVRQATMVSRLLDATTQQRNQAASDYRTRELAAARRLYAEAGQRLPFKPKTPGAPGEQLHEEDYHPEMTGPGRAVYELMERAHTLDPQATDAIVAKHAGNDDLTGVAADLMQLIEERTNGRQAKAGAAEGADVQEQAAEAGSGAAGQPGAGGAGAEGAQQEGEVGGRRSEARPGAPERRQDTGTRKKVAEMTDEEMRHALLTDELTGLGNKRAYGESPKKKHQAFIDVDALGWMNDNMGHEAGDQLLAAVGKLIGEESGRRGIEAFHPHGDEFIAQHDDPQAMKEALDRANERGKDVEITVEHPDGTTITKKGVGFSYGIGKDLKEADKRLYEHKAEREAAGLRAPKGGEPAGVVRTPAAGHEDQEHQSAPDEGLTSSGEAQEKTGETDAAGPSLDESAKDAATHPDNPAPEPSDAQKEAGNYAVGHHTLHGLDLSIENPAGSYRFKYDRPRLAHVRTLLANEKDSTDAQRAVEQLDAAEEHFKAGKPDAAAGALTVASRILQQKHAPLMEVIDQVTDQGWHNQMQAHYGYLKGTVGHDKDHVDVFVHPEAEAHPDLPVYVIDQVHPDTGLFDEHKVMLGYKTQADAKAAYLAHYAKGWKGLGAITKMSLDDFKAWVTDQEQTRQALSQKLRQQTGEPDTTAASRQVQAEAFNVLAELPELQAAAGGDPQAFEAAAIDALGTWMQQQAVGADAARQAAIRTLTTLPADFWTSLQKEAAKRAPKQPKAKKLERTGADIKRAWDALQEQLKAQNKAEGITALNQIYAATARAKLFEGALPEDATPGAQQYFTIARDAIVPIKAWLRGQIFGRWASSRTTVESWVRGDSRVVGERGRDLFKGLSEELDKQMEAPDFNFGAITVQQRLDVLNRLTRQYVDVVADYVDRLRGKGTVKDQLDALSDYLWRGKPSRAWPLTDEHTTAHADLLHALDIMPNDSTTFRLYKGSAVAEHLLEREHTIEGKTRKQPLVPPRLERITRDLPPVREGDVTPQQMKDAFGFADIDFGNWVKTKEDQALLNHAYDSFMDLARFLGLPPKAIGFSGQLYFTLGALGQGSKAAATFHPAHPHEGQAIQVINLTKTKGDGTVAHEWFHALDHFLRDDPDSDWALTKIHKELTSKLDMAFIRERAIAALKGRTWIRGRKRAGRIENAEGIVRYYASHLKATDYKAAADAMDKNYWGNREELLARAFEAYVADNLQGTNDFLVNGAWVGDGMVTPPTYKGTPYPRGDERAYFHRWYEALAHALQMDEDGRVTVNGARFKTSDVVTERLDGGKAVQDLIAELPQLYEQIQRENTLEAEAAQRKREAAEAAAAEAAKLDAELDNPTAPQPGPDAPLSDEDLEALFDAAADNVKAEDHEDTGAPPPGAGSATDAPKEPRGPSKRAGKGKAGGTAEPGSAAAYLKKAADLGVKGLDEALNGLNELFGKGRLRAFPGGFDEETYAKAKPHFEAALKAFQEMGHTLKDLFAYMVRQWGEGIKPYAVHFAKDMKLTAALGQNESATRRIANYVRVQLKAGNTIPWQKLFKIADAAYRGTQAEGKYTVKDAYDAMEAGMNLHLREVAPEWLREADTAALAHSLIRLKLMQLTDLLPTQTKRTAEQDEFQQFSTVPTLAFVANWVAKLTPGETYLEPSAGTGGLAVFGEAAGARIVANELSSRRAAVLREVLPEARVFSENAEHLHNILPDDVQPTVIVMNPPFSATAGRVQGERDSMNGARHITAALARLRPGGRLVAIVGESMDMEGRFAKWWKDLQKDYTVKANVRVGGADYAKYGTTYDNRLLVIDKIGPQQGEVVTGKVDYHSELPALLESVRNERKIPTASDLEPEYPAPEPGGGGPGAPGLEQPDATAGADTGTVGAGAGGAGAGARGRGGGRRGGGPGAGGRRPGAGHGPAGGAAGTRGTAKRPAGGEPDGPGGDTGPGGQLDLDTSAIAQRDAELTDAIFETYRPEKARFAGTKPHPGKLVESAAMASTAPPDVTYRPDLPQATIEKGLVSDAQVEAATYAGQAHDKRLPNGRRMGYFIGDGTGVGKGREISAIILDNWRRGRTKHVWVSEKAPLLADAKRDFEGIGGDPDLVVPLQGYEPITHRQGIVFTTYSTLRSAQTTKEEGKPKKVLRSRVDQLVEWLGKDFDGVIAFDEAHNMANLLGKTPSKQAVAAQELSEKLPHARVVYVSATGATEVENLAYADRLGLWGEKTPFENVKAFVAQIASAGLAAMELVARDLKAMGKYIARSLSFDGVTYERLPAELTPLQVDIYNELAKAWQIVLQNMEQALEATNADKNGQAKGYARGQFWSSHQRFFNQVLTALQTPSIIDHAKAEYDKGNAIVFQLVNTNEATQERAVQSAEAEGTALEELDFTPKQILTEFLKKSFPTQQFEEYTDENGNTRSRPVFDSAGNPVHDKALEAKRDALIAHIETNLRIPDNPLDMLLEAFGTKDTAEITGRGRRFVRQMKPDGSYKMVEHKRSAKIRKGEADEFQGNKRRVLIFSDAGGTGFSFHSDLGAKNQRRRIHYLVQPGWRADKAVQGFGRTHRSNEANQPHYVLPQTNIKAQKRFISSIARRLDQLGALTKGQRDTASQGMFSNRDNLESQYAQAALRDLMETFQDAKWHPYVDAMGLRDVYDESHRLVEAKLPNVQRFLNRLLSLTTDQQDTVFTEFEQRMDAAIDAAVKAGTFDDGLQTLKALKVVKKRDEVVYTDDSGAKTRYLELTVTKPTYPQTFEDIQPLLARYARDRHLHDYFYDNQTRQPFAVVYLGGGVTTKGEKFTRGYKIAPMAPARTSSGTYVENVDNISSGGPTRVLRQPAFLFKPHDGTALVPPATLPAGVKLGDELEKRVDRYKRISADEAAYLWNETYEQLPRTQDEPLHLLTGSLLPIWDRLPQGYGVSVVRTATDEGERLLGRQVPAMEVKNTLKNLGVGSVRADLPPQEAIDRILGGEIAQLSNGWTVRAVKVSNDTRLELNASFLSPSLIQQLQRQGAIVERIQWSNRAFIPRNAQAFDALTRGANRPVVDFLTPRDDEDPLLSRKDRPRGAGQSYARVDAYVRHLTEAWSNAPPHQVVQSVADLPEKWRNYLATQGAEDSAEALYDPKEGKVWYIADNIPDLATAERATFHEMLGHHGLRGAFGRDIERELGKVYARYGRAGLADIAKTYGLDLDNRIDRLKAAEEKLAELAEGGDQHGLWAGFVATVRDILRRLGFTLAYTDADIAGILRKAARATKDGEPSVYTATTPYRAPALSLAEGGEAPTFYRQLERQARAKLPGSGTGAQFKQAIQAWVRKGEVKQEELDWSGLSEWLDEHAGDKLTKADVVDYLAAHQIQVNEILHGYDSGSWAPYQAAVAEAMDRRDAALAEFTRLDGFKALGIHNDGQFRLRTQMAAAGDRFAAQWLHDPLMPDQEAAALAYGRALEDIERLGREETERRSKLLPAQYSSYVLDSEERGGPDDYRELVFALPNARDDHVARFNALRDRVRAARPSEPWRNIYDMRDRGQLTPDERAELAAIDKEGEKLPKTYTHGHWPGIVNPLAHVRFDTRVDADGKRVLFIEEVQSDWHQAGRKQGYGVGAITKEAAQRMGYSVYRATSNLGTEAYFIKGPDNIRDVPNTGSETERGAWNAALNFINSRVNVVPDAPFKTTWPLLAMKRMIRWAAEHGYDRIAWTTGAQQAERFDLSQAVKTVGWGPYEGPGADGRKTVVIMAHGGGSVEARVLPDGKITHAEGANEIRGHDIREVVGKDLGEKILSEPQGKAQGDGLRIGGTGMAGFYDRILPAEANKYIKRWGAKVGRFTIAKRRLIRHEEDTPSGRPLEVVPMETGRDWTIALEGGDRWGWYSSKVDAENDLKRLQENYREYDIQVHGFDVTDAMRASALQGQPLFRLKKQAKAAFDELRKRPSVSKTEMNLKDSIESVRRGLFAGDMNDKAKAADAALAANVARAQHEDAAYYGAGEKRKEYWDAVPEEARLAFLHDYEAGKTFDDPTLNAAALAYRRWMQEVFDREQSHDIQYEPRDNYIYHLWENPERVAAILAAKFGVNWADPRFTKERAWDYIQEGLAHGERLVTTNPEEIMQLRQHASTLAIMRVNALRDMAKYGAARQIASLRERRPGETYRRSPNGELYAIADEAVPVFINAFESPSLWQARNVGGVAFRGIMRLKNMIVPLKLGLSLFHPIHVLGIDSAARITHAFQAGGDIKGILHGLSLPGLWDYRANGPIRTGWRIVQAFNKPINDLTDTERTALQMIAEGGGVPQMSKIYRIEGIKRLKAAIAEKKYAMATAEIMPAALETLQKPIFEHWIPALKVASYLNEVKTVLAKRPDLADNELARRQELRRIWQSVDNRYGEMTYSTLFWNRYIRDIATASTLSLGWNLGFVREYGGAAGDWLKAGKKLATGKMTSDDISRRMMFTAIYTMEALALGGLMTYFLSGNKPEKLLDYVYPQTGDVNPDGTPARVNTQFYTREFGAMWAHYRDEGLVDAGLTIIGNKLSPALADIHFLWRNYDYFGNEIADPNAPAFKRLEERVVWTLNDQLPISLSSPSRAGHDQPRDVVLSVLGFSPAPGYVTETGIEGKIWNTYHQYHVTVTPYDQVQYRKDLKKWREYVRAGDREQAQALVDRIRKEHNVTGSSLKRMYLDMRSPPAAMAFRELSDGQQLALLEKMTPEEARIYMRYAHPDLRGQFYRKAHGEPVTP